MAFPPGKLINAQKTRSGERLVFLHCKSFLRDFLRGNAFKALLHQMMTHSKGFGHMRDGLSGGLFAERLS
jgi:hypothetical protein